MNNDEILTELAEINKLIEEDGVKNLPPEKKKQFWKLVGKIKRQETPNQDQIKSAATIREMLHQDRFGKPLDTNFMLGGFGLSAVFLFLGFIVLGLDSDDLGTASILTYAGYVVLFTMYFYIIDFVIFDKFITFLIILLAGVFELALLFAFVPGFLAWLVYVSGFGIVPALYPFGRWIASQITKIKIEGGVRDVYGLVNLKTNYESYLSASPENRHWFFFISGLGTTVTSIFFVVVDLVMFDRFWFIFAALALLIGETYDYVYGGGRWAGEFGHARRERLIIADIKKSG
jgi:hypothetical protein